MSFPPATEMFQFAGFASASYGFTDGYPQKEVGCPIRRSQDQRALASPLSFSQRATSFIASRCQGIHQMPFSWLAPRPAPSAPFLEGLPAFGLLEPKRSQAAKRQPPNKRAWRRCAQHRPPRLDAPASRIPMPRSGQTGPDLLHGFSRLSLHDFKTAGWQKADGRHPPATGLFPQKPGAQQRRARPARRGGGPGPI